MADVAHLYKITHLPSGRFYYGKRQGTEQNGYWGSGKVIRNLIKKYPRSDFEYKVLVISNVEYIYDLEAKIVNEQLLKEEKCLNLTIGGRGCRVHTQENIEKFRKQSSERVHSEEVKKRMSESAKNRPSVIKSEIAKTNISKALKEFYIINEHIISEQTIEKIKATKKANPTGTGKWMNNGVIQTKIKPELIDKYTQDGWVFGRLRNYITEEYKEKQRMNSIKQWQGVKS